MAVSLSKGQKVDLTKAHPGLQNVVVGLGWDVNNFGGNTFDLDASAFLLGGNGKVSGDQDFVFYNNPQGGQGSVIYTGDNRTGVGQNDDEQIRIDLSRVPMNVQRISFTITIHDADIKRQSFGQVNNAYVRIYNEQTGEILIQYNLGQNFSVETAIVAAELYRHNGEWKFAATGSGFSGGLAALCNNFGIQVDQPQPVQQPMHQQPMQSQPNYGQQPSYQQPVSSPNYVQQPMHNQQPMMNQQPQYQQPSYGTGYNNHQMNQQPMTHQPMTHQHMGVHGHHGHNHSSSGFSCRKCHSPNVNVGKKGFGLGKAAIGGLLLGPVGVLGGFIGGNKLKITCIDCGFKWEPQSSEITQKANELKYQAKRLFQQHNSPDLLDSVVAGFALVSTADGYIDPAEKRKIHEFVTRNEELRIFGTHQVISRFDYYVNVISRDPFGGKAEALRAVGKMRYKQDVGRLIIRYCIAIGYADGQFAPQEQQVVAEICRELGLNPVEFLY